MVNDERARPGKPQPSTDAPDTRADVDPDVARLLGLRPTDAESMPTADEVDSLGKITDTRIYQGDLEARPAGGDQPGENPAENLESLIAGELRDGETDDALEAAEEGLAWVPPVDPPIIVNERGEAEVGAGFATSADHEPFDADHHGELLSPLDEVEGRVVEALRAHAETSGLVDGLEVDAEGGRVIVAGVVDDLVDEESILGVVEDVDGVQSVVSRLQILSLAEPRPGQAEPETGGTRR